MDTDGAIQEGTFILQDVAKTFPTFMVKDMLDAARFFEVVSGHMEAAAKAAKHSRVVACGECSPLLLAEGKLATAIRIEQIQRPSQNAQCRYPVYISIEQLSRRGRRARFSEHLRGT
ncbi:MAG: hypothetical protein WBQ59_02090, partial [Candidatus Acidiferrum sp.]